MGYHLKYFMWSYQLHFQINAENDAKSLFKEFDARFSPRVFLVGFQETPIEGSEPICVAPDDCFYQPEIFANVRATAKNLERCDPDRNILHSHPKADEYHHQRIKRRAHITALLQAVEGATERPQWLTFCSGPIALEGYLVSIVLQLQTWVFESYYRLHKNISHASFTRECRLERSFLDALVGEFLSASAECLAKPSPGEGFLRNIDDVSYIPQAAAKRLMFTASAAGDTPDGLHGLYETCNAISTLKYESKEGVGKLVIAMRGHPDIQPELLLEHPVQIRDYGAVRKLLQMASGHLSLLSDASEIYGLGVALASYNPVGEDLFIVNFSRHFVWELTHAGQALMFMRFGEPAIWVLGFPDASFRTNLTRVFPDAHEEQVQRLCHLGRNLSELGHGGMLLVSGDAEGEAKRLAAQGTPVKPFPLDSKLLPFVSSIDGAVLVDLDGNCYAIGVILDGMASPKCMPARGARYNSAVRYVYGRTDAVAIVKSEDGMIDIVPNLMPRIRRADLADALKDLRRVAEQETVDPKEFYDSRKWLDGHRFYLATEQCEDVNRLIAQAMDRFPEDTWKVGYAKFVPDEDMNSSYFLEEVTAD